MATKLEDIRSAVLDQIAWDDRLDGREISVDVEGTLVTLTGSVNSQRERNAAEVDAEVIPGVRRVDNRIEVRYAGPRPEPELLSSHIRRVLSWIEGIDTEAILVDEADGDVTLTGTVDALWKKQNLERVLRRIAGVRSVDNQVTVKPTEDVKDGRIASEIRSAMRRNRRLLESRIDVEVFSGRVRLTGTVPDAVTRREAESTAAYTPGVQRVTNEIEVVPAA